MQELETITRERDEVIKSLLKSYPVPDGLQGIKVKVDENHKLKRVVVTIGDLSIVLSVLGARDLALALRQAANRAERKIQ